MAEINAFPIPYLGMDLDDNAGRIAIGLCLGQTLWKSMRACGTRRRGRLSLGKLRLT